MAKLPSSQKDLYPTLALLVDEQMSAYDVMLKSKTLQVYTAVVRETTAVMQLALTTGDFETILKTELAIQEAEHDRLSKDPKMMESVRKTQKDMEDGRKDYEQLTKEPGSYFRRGYRDRDRTGPNKEFPVDTMRKALRSQATRVGNFAKNPMLSSEEKEFHNLRVGLLKKAEKLYEQIQYRALLGESERRTRGQEAKEQGNSGLMGNYQGDHADDTQQQAIKQNQDRDTMAAVENEASRSSRASVLEEMQSKVKQVIEQAETRLRRHEAIERDRLNKMIKPGKAPGRLAGKKAKEQWKVSNAAYNKQQDKVSRIVELRRNMVDLKSDANKYRDKVDELAAQRIVRALAATKREQQLKEQQAQKEEEAKRSKELRDKAQAERMAHMKKQLAEKERKKAERQKPDNVRQEGRGERGGRGIS